MPDWAVVHRELRRPNVTLALLWEEYRGGRVQDGFGYSWFCDLYRDWAGRLKPTMRQVHIAGERVFVDFAGRTSEVIDGATGEIRRARSSSPCSAPPASPTPRRPGRQIAAGLDRRARPRLRVHFGGAAADGQRQSARPASPGPASTSRWSTAPTPTWRALRHRDRPGAPVQAARQGQGRGRRPGRAALDPGAVAATGGSSRWPNSTRRSATCSITQRSADARLGHEPARALRAARPARARAAAADALRIRRLEALPGQPRLPRRDRQAFLFSVPYQLLRQEVEARITAKTVEIFHRGKLVASPSAQPAPVSADHGRRAHAEFAPALSRLDA